MQSVCLATVVVVVGLFLCCCTQARALPIYQPQESFDTYHGVLGHHQPVHHHYPVKALHGHDDYHKYGGIGKKAHVLSNYDHGAKGYKNNYGDSAYANQGLNKYDKNYLANKYGGNHQEHHNHHGSHVYTRNRGYGFEKHYMYDKEYSTAKREGADSGHASHYGDMKKDNKYGLDSYSNYGHKRHGHNDGHDLHALGKLDHLIDHHAEHGLNARTAEVVPETYVTKTLEPLVHHHQPQYIPVVGDHYGGALGHAGAVPYVDDLHYDDLQQHHLPSQAQAVYTPAGAAAAAAGRALHDNVNSKIKLSRDGAKLDDDDDEQPSTKQVNIMSIPLSSPGGVGSTVPAAAAPVISAKATTLATLADAYPSRVNSAVHATPAVISTHTGAHYYSS